MTLEELIAKSLRVAVAKINDDVKQKDLRHWDSMGHLELVIALEKAYAVKFSTAEMLSMTTVARIKEMLVAKGKTL